jgi:acyl-CoA thioesterase
MTPPEQSSQSLELIRRQAEQAGYFQLLGLHIDAAQDGKGVVSIHVDSRLMHPHQVVHGGVIFTLADTAMSMALMSVLPPYTRLSTIEAKINYLLPVLSGDLVAEAALVHRGRSTAVMEATIYNNDGDEHRAIARALGTFKISNSRYTPPQEESAK